MKKFTDDERAAWENAHTEAEHEVDDWQVDRLVRLTLMTPEQDKWLREHSLSIPDLLNGRWYHDDEEGVYSLLFGPWNAILRGNGIERWFSEHPIGDAMRASIQETLGEIGVDGFEFK